MRKTMWLLPYAAVLIGMVALKSGWTAILLYHAGIVLFVGGRREWKARSTYLFSGWNAGWGIVLLVVCALTGPTVHFLWPRMTLLPGGLGAGLAEFGLVGIKWRVFVVYFCTVHPFLEELFWRPAADSVEKSVSVWAQHALFAGYHVLVLRFFIGIPWLILVFLILMGVSIVWAGISKRQNGALLPLLSHAVADVSIMLAVYLLL